MAKLAIGLTSVAGFACLKRTVEDGAGRARLFLPGVSAWWLISRLGLFITLFVILDFNVPSDVPYYYYQPAKVALQGKIAYRDFSTSYGPIFPYIAAGAVAVWDSPKAIVLLAIVIEGIALLFWQHAATSTMADKDSKIGLLLYLCNPVPILNIAVAGQNQIWVSCLLAASFVLFLSKREFLSGFLIGLSVAAVKVLGLMFVPYWWLMSKTKFRFSCGIILALALGFFPFYWVGADMLQPLKLEGSLVSSGNLPYLLSLVGFNLTGQTTGLLLNLLLLAAVGTLSLILYKRARLSGKGEISLLGLAAILLTFLLLSKKSYTNYLNLAMLPLCCSAAVTLRGKWRHELFLVWCCVAALEPSLWHRWLAQANLNNVLHQMAGNGAMDFKPPLFVLVELLLLGGYAYLLRLILRHFVILDKRVEPERNAKS